MTAVHGTQTANLVTTVLVAGFGGKIYVERAPLLTATATKEQFTQHFSRTNTLCYQQERVAREVWLDACANIRSQHETEGAVAYERVRVVLALSCKLVGC